MADSLNVSFIDGILVCFVERKKQFIRIHLTFVIVTIILLQLLLVLFKLMNSYTGEAKYV